MPLLDVSEKAFAYLLECTEDHPDIQMSVMVEYYPLTKINSVSSGSTAYRRVPYPNVVNIIRWKENTPENVKWAQMSSRKVMEIVNTGVGEASGGLKVDGYGNYGKCFEKIYMILELNCRGICGRL
jgi:hypothetical protein